MIVCLPYADGPATENHLGGICPQTLAALRADGIEPLKVAISPYDPGAYWRAVAAMWALGQTFAIVEQDIVPHPGALAELERCSEPWCAFPYSLKTGFYAALGCVRFSASLLAEYPEALERVGEIDDDGLPARDWRRLDTRIARVLSQDCDVRIHVHEPAVGHLNPAQHFRSPA